MELGREGFCFKDSYGSNSGEKSSYGYEGSGCISLFGESS